MEIDKIGGEFALIDRLCAVIPNDHSDLIAGVGDDAAVIQISPGSAPYLLVTTDVLVENQHFKSQWSKPEQIGIKASECNISDIAAMGGRPSWMFISLVLRETTSVEWAQKLYAGIAASCRRHGVIVAGGDTTRGAVNTISITLLGTVSPNNLCLRSQAKPGDHLVVTGTLGASAAALSLLEHGKAPAPYLIEKHLTPRCRLDVSEIIAPHANAMIDISDGLGSDLHHICRQSKVGAEVFSDTIPIHEDVRTACRQLKMDPLEIALYGGEDFELLFTMSTEKMAELADTGLSFYAIGRITEKEKGPQLVTPDGKRLLPMSGFDHFKQ